MSAEEESKLCEVESNEGLGNIEGVSNRMSTDDDGEYITFTDEIPQTLESDDNINVIDFMRDNTEDMINIRYREFNKALTDLACLVDIYSAEKKTINISRTRT